MSVKLPEGSAPVDGSGAAVPPIDPAAFADAHRQLLADPTIQFDLPSFEPPAPPWAWAPCPP